MCDTIPGEMSTCILTPDREPVTDQHTGTTKAQLRQLLVFIVITYKSIGGRLLIATEMMVKVPLPKLTAARILEHIAQPAGSSAAGEHPFQATQLIGVSQ